MTTKRTIEVFTSEYWICVETLDLVNEAAWNVVAKSSSAANCFRRRKES